MASRSVSAIALICSLTSVSVPPNTKKVFLLSSVFSSIISYKIRPCFFTNLKSSKVLPFKDNTRFLIYLFLFSCPTKNSISSAYLICLNCSHTTSGYFNNITSTFKEDNSFRSINFLVVVTL